MQYVHQRSSKSDDRTRHIPGLNKSLCSGWLLAVFALLASPAHAIPIPKLTGVDYFLTDNVGNFDLFVLGGPVTKSEQNLTFAAGANWKINLGVVIQNNFTPNRDRVLVFGEVFHNAQPHPPEGVGGTLGFTFSFDPAAPAGTPVSFGIPGSRKHKDHRDNYSFYDGAVIGGVPFSHYGVVGGGPAGANDITRWFFGIKGIHTATPPVPEPSIWSILALGLATLSIVRARHHRSQHAP
jgi:hypothetical protein